MSGWEGSPVEPLTQRESEIVRSLASGRTAAEIADVLAVSCHTVKTHIRNVYLKLGISNRIELMMLLASRSFEVFGRHGKPE